MNQKKLNFNIQNLVVDYITFKFQESHCDPNKIAKYLFNLGFNSYQQSGKLSKPVHSYLFRYFTKKIRRLKRILIKIDKNRVP
jgi:hypothetical protein